MSYDITLNDRVTGEIILFEKKHYMGGGTFAVSGSYEAWLNITYNYSRYYYEATNGDERFANQPYLPNDDKVNYGIRGIYGKSGAESIPMLKDMIMRIEDKYKKDGEWIYTKRKKYRWIDEDGRVYTDPYDRAFLKYDFKEEEYEIEVCEGPNEDYWEPTAGNAIKPLWQLLAFAQMRPDGVWDGD